LHQPVRQVRWCSEAARRVEKPEPCCVAAMVLGTLAPDAAALEVVGLLPGHQARVEQEQLLFVHAHPNRAEIKGLGWRSIEGAQRDGRTACGRWHRGRHCVGMSGVGLWSWTLLMGRLTRQTATMPRGRRHDELAHVIGQDERNQRAVGAAAPSCPSPSGRRFPCPRLPLPRQHDVRLRRWRKHFLAVLADARGPFSSGHLRVGTKARMASDSASPAWIYMHGTFHTSALSLSREDAAISPLRRHHP